ncbi:hypothetical protein [Mycetocola tolaasinivorans]|uniref:hypothetical protein n=1 Tax=Mycetocola tolaasinivorans TaxID=76635 RepID=UPI0011C3E14C|nr:hypothetical protein [Mycetocola tolaasinivorans]
MSDLSDSEPTGHAAAAARAESLPLAERAAALGEIVGQLTERLEQSDRITLNPAAELTHGIAAAPRPEVSLPPASPHNSEETR